MRPLPRFLAILFFAIPALAQDSRIIRTAEDVNLIVEFRDAPILSAAKSASFDARFAQFENDLRGIAAADAHVTHTFQRVFAGTSVTVPARSVEKIQQLPYVARIYRDGTKHTLLDDSVNLIEANQVWSAFGNRARE